MGKKKKISEGYKILDQLQADTYAIQQVQQEQPYQAYSILENLRRDTYEQSIRQRGLEALSQSISQRKMQQDRLRMAELNHSYAQRFAAPQKAAEILQQKLEDDWMAGIRPRANPKDFREADTGYQDFLDSMDQKKKQQKQQEEKRQLEEVNNRPAQKMAAPARSTEAVKARSQDERMNRPQENTGKDWTQEYAARNAAPRKSGEAVNQQLRDLAMAKVADQNQGIQGSQGGLFTGEINENFFQDLMGQGTELEQQLYGAMMLRDPELMGNLTSEQLLMLKTSAENYADTLEQSRTQLEEEVANAETDEEFDSKYNELNQLDETVQMWRDGAQRLEWKANTAQRQEKISGYEEDARGAEDYREVSGAGLGSDAAIEQMPLQLYNSWLEYGYPYGIGWEDYYAEQGNGEAAPGETPNVLNPLEFYLAYSDYENADDYKPEGITSLMGYGDNNNWDKATREQRQTFAYLWETDQRTAMDYLESLQIGWSQEAMSEWQTEFANSWDGKTGWGKAGDNALSISANVAGGLSAGVGLITGMIDGYVNPYTRTGWGQQYAGMVRELTSDDIYSAVGYDPNSGQEPNFLQQALVNGYNGLMSAADSAFGASILGMGYTATMGIGSAAQKAQELYERGASDNQILIGAAVAGSIETLFEYVSLDKIIKIQDGTGIKNFLVNTLKSSGIEGSEEMFTEIANKVAESIQFGANSDTKDRENYYIALGLSPEDARSRAIQDAVVDVFWAAYGGMISGAAFGATGVPRVIAQETGKAKQAIQERQQYRTAGKSVIQNQTGPELVRAAEQVGLNPKLREIANQKAAERIDKMNTFQRRKAEQEIGKLYEQTLKAQQEKAKAEVRDSFQQVAEEKIRQAQEEARDAAQGQEPEQNLETVEGRTPVDPKIAAEALTKAAYGEELTELEQQAVEEVGGDALIDEIAKSREFRETARAKTDTMARQMEDTMALARDTTKQKEFVSRFARENGMDEDVMMGSIRRSQDAAKFTTAWKSAYEMGAGDIAVRYAQKAGATSYLTQEQIETAYTEGRKAAGYYEEAAGKVAVPDSGQWNDRAYSGGELRQMETGAAEQGKLQQQGAGGGIAPAAEKVTSIELGIQEGTENRNLQRIQEAAYNEDTKAAYQVAKDNGLAFVAFSGGALETYETVNGSRVTVKSRGAVVNGTMYVRVDDNTFTAAQIAKHEAAHEQIRRGEIDVEAAKESLLDKYSQEEIDAIIDLYAQAYGNSGLTAEEVLEEILCDAMGNMNAFATETTERLAGEVGVFLRDVKKAAQRKGGQKKNATGDGGVTHYSRETQYDPETAGIKEQIRNSAEYLNKMEPADNIIVPENMKEKRKAEKWAIEVLQKTGYEVERKGFGTIYFNEKDIRKAMNYCDTPEEKAAIAAIPKVLKRGIEIGGHFNHKNRNKSTITFAAPVILNGIRGNVGVVVNKKGNHYYTHRIIMPDGSAFVFGKENDAAQEPYRGVTTKGSLASTTSAASTDKVAQAGADVKKKYSREMDTGNELEQTRSTQFKKWFGDWENNPQSASKVINNDGTPKIVYHQTSSDFTIFDTRHEGAGTRDSDMPFGIFMKSSDKDIGLKGGKQMALYARIMNPLVVRDREELVYRLNKISEGYSKAAEEHRNLDYTYQQKFDDAKKAWREYMEEWRKENPNASRSALYEDERFTKLFDAEDDVIDEWERKAREIETKAKEAITRELEKNGYDGVIISRDKGSFGRETDAYIALHPEQVKSATDNIGEFDKMNPDIRYSREMDTTAMGKNSEGEQLSEQQIEYFRDSKARDESGNLMVLYHGTPDGFISEPYYGAEEKMDREEYPFTVFQQGADTGINNGMDSIPSRGIWLTSEKSVARDYAQGSGVFKLYANIKNPLDARTEDGARKVAVLLNEYYKENFGVDVSATEDAVLGGMQDLNLQIEKYGLDFHDGINYVISQMQDGIIDYDGLFINDIYRGEESVSFVAISPEQVKNENNTEPTENKDIRFSREMDTQKALERQNALLREKLEYWKEQTRTRKNIGKKADKAEVRKLARKLLRDYESETSLEEILPELQSLANQNDGYTEMSDIAQKIARKILEGSGVDVNGELAETRKALKQYLRATPINVTDSIKSGIPDFSEWKKQNRALHFREDGSGTDVDSMWVDLQDQFGTGMFPDDVMNPEDQVRYIADKLQAVQEEIRNPYAKDMELAVQQAAMDILNSAMELDPEKPTRADKAAERETAEMNRLLEEGRQRERERITNAQKTEARQNIKNISEKFQRMATRPGKGISQHAPERLKKAVLDFCELFTEAELRRMDRWQKSLEYRADELGRKMNTVLTKSFLDEYGKIESQQERRDRATAKLSEMRNAYEKMKESAEYQTVYDEQLGKMMEALDNLFHEKDLYQLDTMELRQVQNTLTALYHTITNANKAFSMGKDKNISDMAQKMAREIRQTNPKQAGMQVAGMRFMQWQMSPDTFFNYICGYIKNNEGKVVQDGFRRGSERMMGVQRDFYQMFQEFTESKDSNVQKELRHLMNFNAKELVSWGLNDLEGNEVQTARGMMLQAYMMLNQKDSFESLQHGGFSIPNMKRYYKGDRVGSYGDALETKMLSESIGAGYNEMVQRNKDIQSEIEQLQQRMEEAYGEKIGQRYQEEIQKLEAQIRENRQKMEAISNQAAERLYNIMKQIEKQLTPLEKKLMERANEWYAYSGKLMSEVFEQMYGFRPKLVENYVPIHRDPSTIKTDIRDMAGAEKAFNLENSGFTIERVKNSQPILLTDFFDELNRQSDKMARYVGFAQVQKDFGKIWKTRVDANGMTINTLVRARFGAGKTNLGVSGEEYINHYIADVAGGHSSEDIMGKFYGNYAAATLRLNPRVAISQAASIPTAASVVGWKSMAVGFAKGLPKSFSTKYRNDLASKNVWFYQRYKGQGGSTELSEISRKGNVIETIANSRVGKKLFNWCQEVDVWATGSIMWNAAEDYVQRQGIQKGTPEYEAAVNQAYTDIIRKSQPNYTVTERSDLLRDQRAHMKLLTMFKTQSNQNLNLLLEANGEFMRMRQDFKNGRNGVTEADVKAAGKRLANAGTGVLIGGTAAFVGLRTIMNFILGAVDPYRDDETDEVTMEATLKGIGKEILSSLAGTVALGGQVYDILMPIITGDTYYGLSDSAVSALSSMLENTIKVIQNGKGATEKQIWKAVNSWCMVFGIPAGNTKKIYDMIAMYTRDIQNGTFGQFTTDKTTLAQYRARIVEHYLKGEEEKAADALAMLFERSSKDTDAEVNKDIADGMRGYLKELYIAADITDTEAEKIMAYTGTDDPGKYTAKWDFLLEHPEIDSKKVTDALVTAYGKRGNISDKVFLDAWWFASAAVADKDSDGNSINGSMKQKIVNYVQNIPGLSYEQKKRLFLLLDAGSIKGTPWE